MPGPFHCERAERIATEAERAGERVSATRMERQASNRVKGCVRERTVIGQIMPASQS